MAAVTEQHIVEIEGSKQVLGAPALLLTHLVKAEAIESFRVGIILLRAYIMDCVVQRMTEDSHWINLHTRSSHGYDVACGDCCAIGERKVLHCFARHNNWGTHYW